MSAVTLALLFFSSVALNQQVTEGCRCMQRHPQQMFCSSDVVLQAKVIGEANNTLPETTAYEIQTIEKFKPLDKKKIQFIYTDHTSCGINLDIGEYLLSGHVTDGRVFVNLCDRVELWDDLSTAQKKYLSLYRKGCVCEISTCTGLSCLIRRRQKKCLIKDNNSSAFQEALQSICLPDSAGFCNWIKILDK